MRDLLSRGLVSLLIGTTATTLSGRQDRAGNEGLTDKFVGAWQMVSLETPGADGKLHRADSTGLLVFTREGHMSVQVMERNPAGASSCWA
jgi:Lipocalin-like domain